MVAHPAPGENDPALRALDEEFAKASASNDSPPDGEYVVKVLRVELRNSKAGNRMLSWELVVLTGTYVGRHLWHRNMLMKPENMRFVKQDLKTCQVELQKLSDLPESIHRLVGLCLLIEKRTSNDYENIYIKRRLLEDADKTDQPPPAGPVIDYGDVPF